MTLAIIGSALELMVAILKVILERGASEAERRAQLNAIQAAYLKVATDAENLMRERNRADKEKADKLQEQMDADAKRTAK